MIASIIIVFIAITLAFSVAWLRVWRHGRYRDQQQAAADDALRELYRRYWAEVKAVTQAHMLKAPSDEEWLAGIRGRVSMPASKAPSGDVRSRLAGHLYGDHSDLCQRLPARIRLECESALRAQIELEMSRGSLKHHRLPWWMRWIPRAAMVCDFGLLLYLFAGITNVVWARPLSVSLAFATMLAVVVTTLAFGFFAFTGCGMRARKDHAGTVQLRELAPSIRVAAGIAAAAIVGFSAMIFIQMRPEILYALGAGAGIITSVVSVTLAILAAAANSAAIAVYALDGSDEEAFLSKLAAASHLSAAAPPRPGRQSARWPAPSKWIRRLMFPGAILAVLAAGFYFGPHSALAFLVVSMIVFVVGGAIGTIVLVSLGIRREDRSHRLIRQAPDMAFRGVRRLTGIGLREDPALRPDDADH
jgi:hypothetical protein